MRRAFLLGLILCGCATSPAPLGPTPSADGELLAAEQALFTAIAHRDVSALEKLVADDCVFRTTPQGNAIGRREFLASVVATGDGMLEVRGEALQARAFVRSGVVSGLQRARLHADGGTAVDDVGQFIDVFERRGGRWMLVLALTASVEDSRNF